MKRRVIVFVVLVSAIWLLAFGNGTPWSLAVNANNQFTVALYKQL